MVKLLHKVDKDWWKDKIRFFVLSLPNIQSFKRQTVEDAFEQNFFTSQDPTDKAAVAASSDFSAEKIYEILPELWIITQQRTTNQRVVSVRLFLMRLHFDTNFRLQILDKNMANSKKID